MLRAAGPAEGYVQHPCCNMPAQPLLKREHAIVWRYNLTTSVQFFTTVSDITGDNCTMRGEPPDPSDFPVLSGLLKDVLRFFVCL